MGPRQGSQVNLRVASLEKLAIDTTKRLLLERHAYPVGVDRTELPCTPGLRLQWSIRMNLATALLKFGIHRLIPFKLILTMVWSPTFFASAL